VALALGLTAPASAQSGTTTSPTFELSAGYQLFRAGEVCGESGQGETCGAGRVFPLGGAVDAARNFGAFGLVGETGWSYDSEGNTSMHVWHAAAGGRVSARSHPRIWPYVQVLAGVAVSHVTTDGLGILGGDDTSANFLVQPGAGIVFVAGDGWGLVGQVDYRRLVLDKAENFGASGRNDARVFIGARMILD
jgi:hypothetical protein